ncbi:MAG: FecCD family ABC transporter permease [Peptostreptococcaceae bacterium]
MKLTKKHITNKKYITIGFSFIVLALLLVLLSTIGSVDLSFSEIISALVNDDNKVVSTIVYKMRLPRNILAALVGANLAVAGILLQSVMKNSLADPGITGVSTGASVAAIVILLTLPQYTNLLPIAAFVGGAIACILVFLMAYKNGIHPGRIVLAGVAVNTILGGIISFLSTMYSDRIQSAMLWLNGSLATKTWVDVEMLFVYSIIALTASLFLIRSANVLQLGDDAATNLGFNVNLTRFIICAVAVFLAAISTSVVGVISFVGLIVPHISRMIMGSDHKYNIPFSMVLGSIVLLVADTLGRTIGGAIEIPVGVIMSIVGGPFFLYLLRKKGDY